MNGNNKSLNISKDTKITKASVSNKETIPFSTQSRYAESSQHSCKAKEIKNNANVSTTTTTNKLRYVITDKGPKIHESKRKIYSDKSYTRQVDETDTKTLRKPKIRIKHEKKYSGILSSMRNEKSVGTASPHKLQPNLRTDRSIVSNDSKDSKSKRTSSKTNWRRNLPKVKDVLYRTVQPFEKPNASSGLEIKDRNAKPDAESRSIARESEKFYRKRENSYSKRYFEKIYAKEKMSFNGKLRDNNSDDSEKVKEPEKTDFQHNVEINKNLSKRIVRRNDNVDKNVEDNNGAARTRIFKRQENSTVDKNQEIKAELSKNKFEDVKLLSDRKQKRDKKETKIDDIDKRVAQNFIESVFDVKISNVIPPHRGALESAKFNSDWNQYQEFDETSVNSFGQKSTNNLDSAAINEISCEPVLPENLEIDSNKAKETALANASSKTSHHDDEKAGELRTVNEIQSSSQDETKPGTNLTDCGYDSDQRYREDYNKQENKKNIADAAVKPIGVDKTERSINEDAKYNIMKTLTQAVIGIHAFKAKGLNDVNKLFMSGCGSEPVINCKDEGLQNYYTHSLTDGCIDERNVNVLRIVKQSEDDADNLESYETFNSRRSSIDLKKPLSDTSDSSATSLKMKGCKHARKCKHFKKEEKNGSHYVKRIVSDDRSYQGFERSGNPGSEEVKIIINENSSKTSKIKIVNDRSSISVICHSFGRTLSPTGEQSNAASNKAESSGGESSGYKSFNNQSNTENFEGSAEGQNVTIHSEIMQNRDQRDILEEGCDPSTTFDQRADVRSSEIIASHSYSDNRANGSTDEMRDGLDSEKRMREQTIDMKYTLYDTSNYLSTFTNCMDLYLPCEITAYQFEERKGSRIFEMNSKELREKNVNSAELRSGEYLNRENSEMRDELSDEAESSEELSSEKNEEKSSNDQVVILKEPSNLEYRSSELVVDERLAKQDHPEVRTDSRDISVVPAQYRILDTEPGETSKSPELLIRKSLVKFTTINQESRSDVKTRTDNLGTNPSDTEIPPASQVVSKNTRDKRTGNCGVSCFGRSRSKSEITDDPNEVHELWKNRKSTVDSTDTESQKSGRSHCVRGAPRKNDSNKFKLNIFKKTKSSASDKTINGDSKELPKPSPAFLESTTPSQSTIFSTTANNDASQSDITTKSNISISPTNSISKSSADIAAVHSVRNHRAKTISTETIDHFQLQATEPTSIPPNVTELQPMPAAEVPVIRGSWNSLDGTPVPPPPSALPPPPSALPPPYPFCCPWIPYMTQYWQNGQQPPPASTVPLPEAGWQPAVDAASSRPPPAGMVPIPWFAPTSNKYGPPITEEVDSAVGNNFRGQVPPDWLNTPRDYAPCFPCSRPSDTNRRKLDSSIDEDDEPFAEAGEKKQGVKTKKVSNKLFNIFKRKNKAEAESLDEDDKKVKYQRSRPEPKLNNVQTVQDGHRHVEDTNIWESPDIAGIVTPEEIGRCFRRGFRADGLTLSGDNYLCARAPSDATSEQEDVFNFSDHDTPLDFLLALGFSVDEATAAIRDDEVRSRFKAALTEARIWVPHIATTQGTLLYLLAMKAKPKVMRYFLQLVESIVNKRITNAVKLDAYLKILEKVEEGYVSFVTLFGKENGKDDEEDTVAVEKQRRRIFYTIYKYAETEAKEVDKPLTKASVDLLHSLAGRYRSAIGPHLRLLACYIGEGLLTKDVQLEAALIYLSRLDSGDVQLADLEKYCGFPPSERRRVEQSEKKTNI